MNYGDKNSRRYEESRQETERAALNERHAGDPEAIGAAAADDLDEVAHEAVTRWRAVKAAGLVDVETADPEIGELAAALDRLEAVTS